jgi:two-component system cell cycle sensor histidine kinase/response regulator CckA
MASSAATEIKGFLTSTIKDIKNIGKKMMPEKPTRQELELRIWELEQALSECKRDNKPLHGGDQRYQELISRLPIGIYRNTPGRKGRFLLANKTIAQMFGYESVQKFMQISVADLYMDPSERCRFSQQLLSNDSVENVVLCLKKKDGSKFWGSVTASAVRNDQGIVEYFDGIIQDITEQRKAIEEKEIARRLLQSVLDAVPDLLIVIDRDFKIQYTNYKGHDLIKPPEGDLSLTCYGRFKQLDAPCDDCSADPVFSEGRTVDREMVNPADGRIREVRAFPIYNTDGSVEYAVEYVRDITARKQIEEAHSRSVFIPRTSTR